LGGSNDRGFIHEPFQASRRENFMLRAIQTAGAFIALGLGLCLVGWLLRSVLPIVTFFSWFFGIPIAFLGIPMGLLTWFGNRERRDRSTE
jgi:hypothetical protein